MNAKSIVFIALLGLILSGCLVKSLHPFFREKDVIFKKELIGTWVDQKSGKWIISQAKMKKKGSGTLGSNTVDSLLNYYTVTLTENGGVSSFTSHLFKLNNQLFVDFFPEEISVMDLTSFHLVRTHSIAKIEVLGDSIELKWFNEIWLADLFKNNKIRISHEIISEEDKDESFVLTASTDELQKFIIKYGNDPKAFTDKPEADSKDRNEILCYSLKRIK